MTTNLLTLIAALIMVESSGNDLAVGDSGLAYGPLQIHECYVQDVNRIAGTSFTHKDAFDRKKAIRMTLIYLVHYCTQKRLGHVATYEDYARCHNGGLNGYKKKCTEKYWRKVKTQLEKQLQPTT